MWKLGLIVKKPLTRIFVDFPTNKVIFNENRFVNYKFHRDDIISQLLSSPLRIVGKYFVKILSKDKVYIFLKNNDIVKQ